MEMKGLRDIGAALPPGFRFYPSDEELVCHYLYKKIANDNLLKSTLLEIDLHTCEPWQLPDMAKLNANEWYFFSFRDRKYATGFRTNRATISGYWKATGKDRTVVDPENGEVVGMRKTLVFYRNRAPNGIKTGWIMHEFRLETPHMPPKEDWVLCRVFHKGKGEGSNIISTKLISPQYYTFETTKTSSSNMSTPMNYNSSSSKSLSTYHDLPCGYHQSTPLPGYEHNNSQSRLTNQQTSSNLSQLSYKNNKDTSAIIGYEVVDDDGYGFLMEGMDFEDIGLTSNLEDDDIRFDMDHNNMVFL